MHFILHVIVCDCSVCCCCPWINGVCDGECGPEDVHRWISEGGFQRCIECCGLGRCLCCPPTRLGLLIVARPQVAQQALPVLDSPGDSTTAASRPLALFYQPANPLQGISALARKRLTASASGTGCMPDSLPLSTRQAHGVATLLQLAWKRHKEHPLYWSDKWKSYTRKECLSLQSRYQVPWVLLISQFILQSSDVGPYLGCWGQQHIGEASFSFQTCWTNRAKVWGPVFLENSSKP